MPGLGGLCKTEKVGITRGIPFLVDIPLLGILFSSKDYESSAKEVLFILTPTIADMGQDHRRTIEMIRHKHAEKERGGFLGMMDSFCGDSKPPVELQDVNEPGAVDDPNEPADPGTAEESNVSGVIVGPNEPSEPGAVAEPNEP